MGQRDRIAAFLHLAQEELDAAKWLVERSPRQSAYLVQQSAEKLVRAILTDAEVKFGTGHSLAQMAEALPDDHPWIEKILPLDRHSPAATRYRYPTMAGRLLDPPAARELERDVAELADLLAEARRFLDKITSTG